MRYQTEVYVKRKKSNKWVALILVILVLWSALALTDFYKTMYRYEKPMFTILDKKTALEDGGSGKYIGLGYSINLEGDFMPEESGKITNADFYLFGLKVKQVENISE